MDRRKKYGRCPVGRHDPCVSHETEEAAIKIRAVSLKGLRRAALLGTGLVCLALASAGALWLRHVAAKTREAASPERLRAETIRPLLFRAVVSPSSAAVALTGDASIASLAVVGGALWEAGGAGLSDGTRRLDPIAGLSTLRQRAVASWRETLVFAAERGGWGRLTQGGPEEATSSWGRLDVRALVETEGGELLVGARQGLFRVAFGSSEIERVDGESVRAIALLPSGEIAAGGETGLRIVSASGGAVRRVVTPDPWIEELAFDAGASVLWAATPLGIAYGSPHGETPSLAVHPRGGDAGHGALTAGLWRMLPERETNRMASLGPDGSRTEEGTPESFTRLFADRGELFAAGKSGLWRRDRERGFVLVREAAPGSLPRPHVNALAAEGTTLWAGFFDGGLARGVAMKDGLIWNAVPASSGWGVNALLASGGTVWAATLRGLVRLENGRPVATREESNPGAAFSLAATRSGVAVGYGQGVLLPEKRLLSAFHGLPGNQAFALASSTNGRLWVGTPSGLGWIDGRHVARVVAGEGKLPHPWITALRDTGDSLLVATYGGGVVRRRGEGSGESWERFVETDGLKINAGAMLADPSGRVWIGTEGQGLWRSDPGVARFEKLNLPLPSPDVFSLAFLPADAPTHLYVGTDEGLARIALQNDRERE